MSKFTTTHQNNCNVDTFWKIFLDQSFTTKLHINELHCIQFIITEQSETTDGIIRKFTSVPEQNWPAALAKVFGSSFSYTAEGRFDNASKLWRVKYRPSVQPDKILYEATLRVEPKEDNKIIRIAEIVLEAKVFGVGGLIETTLEKRIRDEQDRSSAFMEKWIADPERFQG